jgi:hypothetical protein
MNPVDFASGSQEQLAVYNCLLHASRMDMSLTQFLEDVVLRYSTMDAENAAYLRGFFDASWSLLVDAEVVRGRGEIDSEFAAAVEETLYWCGHDAIWPQQPLLAQSYVARLVARWANEGHEGPPSP